MNRRSTLVMLAAALKRAQGKETPRPAPGIKCWDSKVKKTRGKRKMKHLCRIVWVVLVAVLMATPLWAQQDKQIELNRLALQRQRNELVNQFMKLNLKEVGAFIPVYEEYRTEMGKLGDRTQRVILDYAEDQDNLSDQKALALLDEWLQIKKAELELRMKSVEEFKRVLPPKKVLRFFQLDNKFDAIVNYNLAGSIPLVE